MGRLKIKKISPKDFGKALYKFTGAQQLVDSGKALSKCKPKDAACIAKNLGQMAMAAKGLTPSGIAATIAKNVIKDQIKKKIEAEKKKREAAKKLSTAATPQEQQAAQMELNAANQQLAQADKQIVENQAVVQQNDAEKLLALQQIEQAKLDPNTALQAAKVEQQAVKYPVNAVPGQGPINVGPPLATPPKTEPPKKQGIKLYLMIGGGVLLLMIILFFMLKSSPTQ